MEEIKKKRVLAVDDEEDVLAYLEAWLMDQGFEVEVAHDGNEAWEKARADKPDLITLDIVMPEKTGVKFYRELKKDEEYSKIPVIIITGLQEDFQRFISHRKSAPPPDGYISKPFGKEELQQTIEAALAKMEKKKAGGSSLN